MILEHLLGQLQKELHLTHHAQKDPQGYYTLELNDKISLQLQDLDPGFYIRSIICSEDEKSHEKLHLYLMRANFLGQGTQGAALGLDSEKKQFILAKRIYEDMNYAEFKDTLEMFVNYLDYWMLEIPKKSDLKA